MEGNAIRFGPAWKGWETYRLFAESVKTNLRYVRYRAADDFLAEVHATCGNHALPIPKETVFWRARLGCEYERIMRGAGDISVCWDEPRPYGADGMKPVSNWQSEGRANPPGIPCLYLATTRDTALAEVRPWIGSTISVAECQIRRDLNVIDCSKHSPGRLVLIGDPTRSREDGVWIAIDQAFGTPVARDDERGEYIPTQIIAELFKREGFDGIVYKSLLSEDGLNLVLFNLEDASVVSRSLHKLASIRFDFQPGDTADT
jgi:RES domain-containing protein